MVAKQFHAPLGARCREPECVNLVLLGRDVMVCRSLRKTKNRRISRWKAKSTKPFVAAERPKLRSVR